MKMFESKRVGFTLIELLVVIAIIAILAAILFPVFAKVREKARQTSCASNEKQLGLAMLQYSEDYDESWPSGNTYQVAGASGFPNGWAGQIYAYIKSVNVYSCPDDPTQPTGTNPVMYPLSYTMNAFISKCYAVSPGGTSSIAALNSPSKTVMFLESEGEHVNLLNPKESDSGVTNGQDWIYNPAFDGKAATGNFPNRSFNPIRVLAQPVHTGGSNYVACDGPVKWLVPSRVSGGYTNAVRSSAPQSGVGSYDCGADTPPGFNCPAGTDSMDNGGGPGSATLTFSTL
jgi:prepilin-type N-terminal cleavage/methylation domain-containing protein